MKRIALAVIAVLAVAGLVAAQPLPVAPQEAPADPSWWGSLLAWLHQVQGDLWRSLARAVRLVKEEGSINALGWLLGLSFFYGVVHAAGPGHGKAVIAAYLVGTESAVRRGVILSFLSAAAQGVTAVCVVGLLAALLGFMRGEIPAMTWPLEIAGSLMSVGVGVYLLFVTVRSIRAGRDLHAHDHHGHDHGHSHAHAHDHGHAHTHIAPGEARDWRSGVAVVAAVGLRPCMGAVIVLLFALGHGVFFAGVLATAAISLGTGIMVSALALLSSGARHAALSLAAAMDGWLLRAYWALSLLGAIALILLGLALLIDPTPPPTPFSGAG